ncbi:MAG: FG-GAP-like repeat-containing protein, partial [Candidatus Margulisiibacteriota bacterium]
FSLDKFSVFGPGIDLAAPGSNIVTARKDGGYLTFSAGTSYSAPHIAGLASLILAQDPSLTPDQVMAVIRNSAIDLQTPGWDYKTGWGKIDAYAALRDMNTYVYPNARMFFPKPNSLFYQKKPIEIMGKATSPNFSHYVIEWGWGTNPTEWHTDSVTLENNGLTPVEDGKLGTVTFDASGLVTLKLKVFDQASKYSISTVIIQVDNTVKEGWQVNLNDNLDQITTGDVNNDGFEEIFITGYFYPLIFGLDKNGNPLPGWPKNYRFTSFALGDIDNNSTMEIVGPVYLSNKSNADFYVLKENGEVYPGWPQTMNDETSEASLSPPSIIDLNLNSEQDIIQGTMHWTNLNGQIYVWDKNGALLTGWPTTLGRVRAQAVGDINDDGYPEIIVLDENKQAFVFNNVAKTLIGWPISLPTYPRKIALGKNDNNTFNITLMSDGNFHVFNVNGQTTSGWPKNIGGDDLALGDLNSDGTLEIAAVSGGKVYVWDYLGNLLPNWPQGSNLSRVLIADINGDTHPDIIAFGPDQLAAWNTDGSLVEGFPKFINDIRDIAVSDIDKDGLTNLLIITYERVVYNLNLNAPYHSQYNPWPLNYHDRQRTSNYHTDIISPEINHTPIPTAEVASDIPIVANIIDNTAVRMAKLYFKNTASSTYQFVQMNNTSGNDWEATIPSSVVRLDGVQYY